MSQISVIFLPHELLAGMMHKQEIKCTEGLSKGLRGRVDFKIYRLM